MKVHVEVEGAADRCTKVTAPVRGARAPARLARWRWRLKIARRARSSARVMSRGSRARGKRAHRGSERTHWRMGTCGSTRSRRCVAVPCMRRVVQEGQKPRPLQEKATRVSSPHEAQRTRAKPWARMPQAK
jgi:hypothetical protein